MATVEETGNTRRKASDPVTTGEVADAPYWTTRHGWVIEMDGAAPWGDELGRSEVGVAAQRARERVDEVLERLAHEAAEPWPSWPTD